MQRQVRYRVHGQRAHSGSGTTLNISSNALAFHAPGPLPVGAAIEISVSWPAEAGSTLRLTATGVVIRSDGRVTACTMENSAFRAEELDEDGRLVPFAPDVGLVMTA